jgi:hypothetical protein
LISIISDPRVFRVALIVIGAIGIAAIYLAHRGSETRIKKAKGPLLLLNLNKEPPPLEPIPSSATPESAASAAPKPPVPALAPSPRQPWMLTDLLRMLLIILSLVVTAGFVLILLPQPAVDRMTQDLQSREGASQQEKLAFLYLGDEVANNEFHVRGVVRNITASPIEQLDAAIRFYSHDGSILETTVVRMNKETIAPDEIAQFELMYPNYKMEFASYAVEFKLRQGALVPYKDMRAARAPSQQSK